MNQTGKQPSGQTRRDGLTLWLTASFIADLLYGAVVVTIRFNFISSSATLHRRESAEFVLCKFWHHKHRLFPQLFHVANYRILRN